MASCHFARVIYAWKLNINLPATWQLIRCIASKADRYATSPKKLKTIDREKYDQMQEALSDEMKRRERIKFKVIQRKEFKQPPLANILTWKAKEQIKYLAHLAKVDPEQSGEEAPNTPHDWEEIRARILEVFPISPKNVARVVKQLRMVMRDGRDIKRHDRRVVRRWRELLEIPFEDLPTDALRRTIFDLVDSGKLANIVNAGGVDGMEEFKTPTKSQQVEAISLPENGRFYSLYKLHGSHELDQSETPLDLRRLLQLTQNDEESDAEDERAIRESNEVKVDDMNVILEGIQMKYARLDPADLERLMMDDNPEI